MKCLCSVDQLQEKEGSAPLGKLTASDSDGFSLEELGDSEAEEAEVAPGSEGDQDCTETQVLREVFLVFETTCKLEVVSPLVLLC